MDENAIYRFLEAASDGQPLSVTTASGRTFKGIYNAASTSMDDGLYFETYEGHELRADWHNIADLTYRASAVVKGNLMVPSEHPLSGTSRPGVNAKGVPLKSYTTRNR